MRAGIDSPAPEMNRFAHTWNQFKTRWDAGVVDVKLARKLSREWREVENCGAWPREER